MKILFALSILYLFTLQVSVAKSASAPNCNINEIEISIADYAYCEKKDDLKKIELISGDHPSLYVKAKKIEYSFSRLPVSFTILNIPEKLNISLVTFFNRLSDREFNDIKFRKMRKAFDIYQNTVVTQYNKQHFSAISIINKDSTNNSIYIYRNESQFIYLVKGSFNKMFSDQFLTNLISRQ